MPLDAEIKTFRPVLTIRKAAVCFFPALLPALALFLVSLQTTGNVLPSIHLLVFFTVFLYSLFVLGLIVDLRVNRRIIVFSNGISTYDPKWAKRVDMTFEEMASARIVDFAFSDKEIVVKSVYPGKELAILCPTTDFDDLVKTLSEVAGKDHVLVSTISHLRKDAG